MISSDSDDYSSMRQKQNTTSRVTKRAVTAELSFNTSTSSTQRSSTQRSSTQRDSSQRSKRGVVFSDSSEDDEFSIPVRKRRK